MHPHVYQASAITVVMRQRPLASCYNNYIARVSPIRGPIAPIAGDINAPRCFTPDLCIRNEA